MANSIAVAPRMPSRRTGRRARSHRPANRTTLFADVRRSGMTYLEKIKIWLATLPGQAAEVSIA